MLPITSLRTIRGLYFDPRRGNLCPIAMHGAHRGRVDFILAYLTPSRASPHLTLAFTWIEPVLLLAMGVIVGTIVIIMYLPVFQMAGTVQ